MVPHSQLRSSAESIGPHLPSSCDAAVSGSAIASLISASTTISRRDLAATTARLARNFPTLAFISSNSEIASGATMITAARAACGRFASMDRRAFFHASLGDIWRALIMRSAAVRQPSSRSRWPNQLRRTSSTWPCVAVPDCSVSISTA